MLASISHLGPPLLGSMDPGSWAASIEAGSRFGYELVWVLLLAKLVALLLHSLAARLRLASGKNLAQACHDEYPAGVCLLLWCFWELSLLFLDSAMVLSCAVGLNMVFGLPIFVGVFIVAVNVLFHASFLPFVAPGKSEAILGAVLLPMVFVFVFNALLTGPRLGPLLGGLRPGFKSESLFAVAGLLGANLVPHKLLFRTSFIKKRDTSAVYTILSGCLPVAINFAVLMVAAAAFHNAGFAVLTLQDGSVAVEQVFSSWAAQPAFGIALVCAGISSTWTGIIAGQAASEGFLGKPVNPWLHRLTMRTATAATASLCAWSYGNEGIYQMLVLSQALLVLQLPFTFIPLIRLTSSTSFMGKEKISSLLEVLAWLVLIFILSIDVCLVFGSLFGQSDDWDSNWETSGSEWSSSGVLVIISVATAAIGFLVWLVFAPIRADALPAGGGGSSACVEEVLENPVVAREIEDASSTLESQPRLFSSYKDLSMRVFPEAEVNQVLEMRLGELDKELPASNVVVAPEDLKAPNGDLQLPEIPVKEEPEPITPDAPVVAAQAQAGVEPPAAAPGDDNKLAPSKDEEELDKLDKLDQETAADDLLSSPVTPGDTYVFGSEGGSISRQAGLGRAARRQFSMILEEFWGLLFDYHGQPVVAGQPELSTRSVQESTNNNNSLRHTIRGDGLLTSSSSLDGLTRSHSSLSASTSQGHSSWVFDYPGRSACTLGGEQQFSSLRHFSYHEDVDSQPATIHGYNIASHTRAGALQNARARMSLQLDLQPRRTTTTIRDYNNPAAFLYKSDSDSGAGFSSGNVFPTTTTSRSYDCGQWGNSFAAETSVDRWNPLVYRATGELEKSLGSNPAPLPFDDISPSQSHRDGFSIQAASHTDSLWARQPFEQLFGASTSPPAAAGIVAGGGDRLERKPLCSFSNGVEFDASVLQHLRLCVRKLLQLEGSSWLFRFDNGCDEDLIACVAAREKYLLESLHPNPILNGCGESCAWGSGLVVSFGAWCIHRVLELALVESRPELWGKYTYVLNRLQGILDPGFSPRTVLQPCLCLQGYQQNGRLGYEELLPAGCCWSWGRNSSNSDGKPHGGLLYLEMIKEVENAVGSRKGRTGTAAGDIAFPKGKGNLASVLKRYKRRLGNRTGNGCGARRSIC